MSVPSYLVYTFKLLPIKIPASYFVDIDKLTLKFIQRGKRSRIAYTIVKEKNKVRLTLSSVKSYYKVTVMKPVLYW